jgi:hypothetical protein
MGISLLIAPVTTETAQQKKQSKRNQDCASAFSGAAELPLAQTDRVF